MAVDVYGSLRWVAWNLFLAAIPVAAAYAIAWLWKGSGRAPRPARIALTGVLGAIWLTFLPNTCYLLTEWRHFLEVAFDRDLYAAWTVEKDRGAMLGLVLHTLFYFAYSAAGMLTFALAIRPIHRLAAGRVGRLWVWAAPFFLLMSLGVYLGLVLRFNTWDLLARPEQIGDAIGRVASRPFLGGLVVVFGGFLWLGYIAMDIWFDGLLLRWQRRAGGDGAAAIAAPLDAPALRKSA